MKVQKTSCNEKSTPAYMNVVLVPLSYILSLDKTNKRGNVTTIVTGSPIIQLCFILLDFIVLSITCFTYEFVPRHNSFTCLWVLIWPLLSNLWIILLTAKARQVILLNLGSTTCSVFWIYYFITCVLKFECVNMKKSTRNLKIQSYLRSVTELLCTYTTYKEGINIWTKIIIC